MTQIKAFQTADGNVHTDELSATYHEFTLAIRGAIQSHPDYHNLRNETINLQSLCEKIARNGDDLVKTIQTFRRKINAITARKAKAEQLVTFA